MGCNKSSKNNKAASLDQITAELLKCGEDTVVVELTNLMNKCWQIEVVPDKWQKGVIIKIPKKGNLDECGNWGEFTLLSVPGKVLCVVLLTRLSTVVDSKMTEEQAGFQQGWSSVEQIFMLQIIIEQCLIFQGQLIINFIDFKIAFESVHREPS